MYEITDPISDMALFKFARHIIRLCYKRVFYTGIREFKQDRRRNNLNHVQKLAFFPTVFYIPFA